MLHILVVTLICIVAILLIIVVLMQNSKGGGLAGAFGSAGATQVLGVRRTADFLSKATTYLAALFYALVCSCRIYDGVRHIKRARRKRHSKECARAKRAGFASVAAIRA